MILWIKVKLTAAILAGVAVTGGGLAVVAAAAEPKEAAFPEAEMLAAYEGRPILFVPLVDAGPAMDGDPGDPAWTKARPLTLGFLNADTKGLPAKNRTTVR